MRETERRRLVRRLFAHLYGRHIVTVPSVASGVENKVDIKLGGATLLSYRYEP